MGVKDRTFRMVKHEGRLVFPRGPNNAPGTAERDYRALVAQVGEGEDMEMRIRPVPTQRSVQANAAFHACLFEWAAAKGLSGKAAEEWVDQVKDDLLALRWGYIVRQNQFTGEITKSLVKPHTSTLTRPEFTEIFDLAAQQASEDHFVMTMPDEYKALKAAEQQQAEREARKAAKAAKVARRAVCGAGLTVASGSSALACGKG